MGLLIHIIIAIIVVALPVMFAARLVGAGRATLGWALIAVILQGIAAAIVRGLSLGPSVEIIVAVVVGAAIYAFVLHTTFLRALLIGGISTVIGVLVFVILATALAGAIAGI